MDNTNPIDGERSREVEVTATPDVSNPTNDSVGPQAILINPHPTHESVGQQAVTGSLESSAVLRGRKRKAKSKKSKKSKKRKRSSSRSSSSSTSDDSGSEDDNVISKRFTIRSKKDKYRWSLTEEMAKYANHQINTYIPEKEIQESLLERIPIPDNLQKPRVLDDFAKVLIKEPTKNWDETLTKSQNRLTQVFAPLGTLWSKMERYLEPLKRISGEGSMTDTTEDVDVDMHELLGLVEQTVLLLGQAINSTTYTRRLNVLKDILKDTKDAKSLLKDKGDMLKKINSNDLFGKKFRSHIEDLVKERKKSKEAFHSYSVAKKPTPFRKSLPQQSASNAGRGRFIVNRGNQSSRQSQQHSNQTRQSPSHQQSSRRGNFNQGFTNFRLRR